MSPLKTYGSALPLYFAINMLLISLCTYLSLFLSFLKFSCTGICAQVTPLSVRACMRICMRACEEDHISSSVFNFWLMNIRDFLDWTTGMLFVASGALYLKNVK